MQTPTTLFNRIQTGLAILKPYGVKDAGFNSVLSHDMLSGVIKGVQSTFLFVVPEREASKEDVEALARNNWQEIGDGFRIEH